MTLYSSLASNLYIGISGHLKNWAPESASVLPSCPEIFPPQSVQAPFENLEQEVVLMQIVNINANQSDGVI
jgi:hypothetical protein